VVIDPVVSLSMVVDTSVNSAFPYTGYATATTLRSGKWSSGETYRAYIGFDRAAIAGTHVLSATLSLHQTWAGSCTATQVDAFGVTSLVSGTITWMNQPPEGTMYANASAAYGGTGCTTPGTVALHTGGTNGATLATLVQKWADGTSPPAMVEIRAHDQNDSTAGKIFTASEGGANGPVLSVTYNSFPDVPADPFAVALPDGSVELHGTFTDPDGGTGAVQYTATDEDTITVFTGSGPTVASGQDSPYVVASTVFDDGETYSWKARGSDGTDSSPYTSPQEYYTDAIVREMNEPLLSEPQAQALADEHPGIPQDTYDQCPSYESMTHLPDYTDVPFKGFQTSPTGPSQAITLDEWDPTPAATNETYPAVLLVHGQGWWRGCKTTLWQEAYFLSHGWAGLTQKFIVFSIDYRLSCRTDDANLIGSPLLPLCGWPFPRIDLGGTVDEDPAIGEDTNDAPVHDIQDGMAWVNHHADDNCECWNGQAVMLGSSAGGNLSLLAAATAPLQTDYSPLAVATWSPAPEFQQSSLPGTVYGCDHDSEVEDPDAYQSWSMNCWNAVNGRTGCFGEDPVPGEVYEPCVLDGTYADASSISVYTDPALPPVFFANGGFCESKIGCDPGDPELVGWIEVKDLKTTLEQAQFETNNYFECAVDKPLHAVQYIYNDNYCEGDSAPVTVFAHTVSFLAGFST
jgi:acetyl esterase/lipase